MTSSNTGRKVPRRTPPGAAVRRSRPRPEAVESVREPTTQPVAVEVTDAGS